MISFISYHAVHDRRVFIRNRVRHLQSSAKYKLNVQNDEMMKQYFIGHNAET